MRAYISLKGMQVEDATEHNDIEQVRMFTNVFGERVLQITKRENKVLSLRADLFDFWIVRGEENE